LKTMSRKIRVTPELIEKARGVFERAKQKAIPTGEGLSRGELRALERRGKVRKMTVFGGTRWVGTSGALSYVWSWIGD